MGVYNPHAPRILGQEWVPIRDEDLTYTPAVNVVEIGHGFDTSSSKVLQDARFYINSFPPGNNTGQAYLATIYARGTEDRTGPIRSVVIPCNGGSISGFGAAFSGTTSSVLDALSNPEDDKYVYCTTGAAASTYGRVSAFFAVNSYAPQLVGKRILAVNVLMSIAGNYTVMRGKTGVSAHLGIEGDNNVAGSLVNAEYFGHISNNAPMTFPGTDLQYTTGFVLAPKVVSVPLGEIDPFWSTTSSPNSTTSRMPWTYANLQRFEQSASTRHSIVLSWEADGSITPIADCYLFYMALEVVYCEDYRLAVAGRAFGYNTATPNRYMPYVLGANPMTMRSPTALTTLPILSAGSYSLVLSSPYLGNFLDPTKTPYKDALPASLNAVRQKYALTSHPGVKVLVSTTSGATFTQEETDILPQLTLHTSGGPLTEVHVYGRQAVAQVYGSITATQEIYDSAAGGAATWPQVRFYARRWGDTTVSLTLDSPSIPGSSAVITPDELDALDEVIDGWREVTLTFSSPPSMGTGTNPQWRWSASGEAAGNRWEILGASAPALSGVPGNWLNLVPSPQQLSIATYGQPASGAQINLGWVPQYAPAVTATSDDQTSDAFLIFAQDMPTVTGFSVAIASQPVSGIGTNCAGVTPCGIPSGIYYHQLTWSATSSSVPVSGFGYYELQRMDTVTDWQTIMKSSSPTGASFRDYEARVNVLSSYRIRAVDVYDFAGPWSSTVTSTLTGPGITGGSCAMAGHVLIFTTNERQDGSSNLAYAEIFEASGGSKVDETFAFPEAGFVQYQAMYNRDFFTAFRPLERGGDQFSRTVLVQAAAISSPPTLPGFWALSDMAWDTVSYICVRDEDGNRWFTSVTVPSGRVQLNRSLYFAQVAIVEVTDTASEVDPSA